jgi:hypothetical protein
MRRFAGAKRRESAASRAALDVCTYAVQNVERRPRRARISTFCMRPTGAPRHPDLPLNAPLTFADPAVNA